MAPLLFIPWFRLEAWEIPLPFDLPLLGDTLPIQPFGLLVAFGVLLGAKVAEIFAKKQGLSPSWVADLVAHCVISGFVFGYLLNAAFYHPEYFTELFDETADCRYFGLSSFGGFIGAMIGLLIWRLRRGQPALPYADAVIYALPFGWLFGRMGCFVVHDHPGRVTDFFLAVDAFEVGAPPYQPRHDLGFYEVLWAVVAIITLLVLAQKKRPRGFYVGLVPVMYTPVRFYLDFLRATPEEGGDARYLGLTPGHYASMFIFLVGVAVLLRVLRGPTIEVPPEGAWPPPDEEEGDDEDEDDGRRRKKRKRVSPKAKKAAAKRAPEPEADAPEDEKAGGDESEEPSEPEASEPEDAGEDESPDEEADGAEETDGARNEDEDEDGEEASDEEQEPSGR